jgi:hypothetical protein
LWRTILMMNAWSLLIHWLGKGLGLRFSLGCVFLVCLAFVAFVMLLEP